MTTPGQNLPPESIGGGDISPLNNLSEATWRANQLGQIAGYDQAHSAFNIPGILASIFQVEQSYSDQAGIIQDHSQSITELVDIVMQQLLQGESHTIKSDRTFYISEGVTWLDFIIIGAGGAGGGGTRSLFGAVPPGAGGGGGGEMHFGVPRSVFGASIKVTVGKGLPGGAANSPGNGGGLSSIGAAPDVISAGGGDGGGTSSAAEFQAQGGFGMVPGGRGGYLVLASDTGVAPTGSLSIYSLNGGGGGGGVGRYGIAGGAGGVSPGGGANQPGKSSSGLVATGGGGGGGSSSTSNSGGAGGYPGGGGGGGTGGTTAASSGGAGGAGIVHIIERV